MTQSQKFSRTTKDIFEKCRTYDEPKKVKEAGVYCFFRAIESTGGSTVVVGGKNKIMIGSNNYLGLTHDERVREAARQAITQMGTGCTGSRFLNGNLTLHETLEVELAKYLKKEKCIVFSTGFLANQGSISCLVGRKDVIYSDNENHASIIEGTRLVLGDTLKYKHNDMEDLEALMARTREKYEGAIIIADGIFSMSGDILKLKEIYALAQKYQCRVYVDDAHALGVLGPKGEGTEAHFHSLGHTDIKVDLIMGTFSKSFASLGGYIAGDADVIDYIKHKARTFIFSASMPPANIATVLECLKIVQTEPQHLENLRSNANMMANGLREMGWNTLGSRTPIVPLLLGEDFEAFQFTQTLFERGVFATPVVQPAVPMGCALIRTSYMATHKKSDLETVLKTLDQLGHEFKILGNPERMQKLNQLAAQHFGHRAK
jgi:8-amino-7-oxononanoate synthase